VQLHPAGQRCAALIRPLWGPVERSPVIAQFRAGQKGRVSMTTMEIAQCIDAIASLIAAFAQIVCAFRRPP